MLNSAPTWNIRRICVPILQKYGEKMLGKTLALPCVCWRGTRGARPHCTWRPSRETWMIWWHWSTLVLTLMPKTMQVPMVWLTLSTYRHLACNCSSFLSYPQLLLVISHSWPTVVVAQSIRMLIDDPPLQSNLAISNLVNSKSSLFRSQAGSPLFDHHLVLQ